jgi:hypothetical protein
MENKNEDKFVQPIEAIVSDPEFMIEGLPAGVLSLAKQMIFDGTPREEVVNLLANQLTYEASKEREAQSDDTEEDPEFEASLTEEPEEKPETEEPEAKSMLDDLYKWKRRALRLHKEGKAQQREFQSDCLPADVVKFIHDGLGNCLDQKSISKLFTSAAYLLK